MAVMSNYFTDADLDVLCQSNAYADFIMDNCDGSEYVICNGDTLTVAMEEGYLFDAFIDAIEASMEAGEAYAFVNSQR